MLIKKFQGASEQEALQLAKQELGKDVIITHIKKINPTVVAAYPIIPCFLFAIILFYRGIIYIRASMKMKNNHRQWGLYLFNGILLLIISIFLLAFPLFSMLGIVMVSSILMIYWGFTWIWMAFEIKPKKTIDE